MTDLISSNEIVATIERMEVAGTPHQLRLARLAFLRARHMEGVDPRLVLRYRRKKGKCVGCGAAVRKVILCDVCRAALAYCPGCESLHNRRPGLAVCRRSDYCPRCMTLYTRERRGAGTRADDLARRQEERHRLLPELIRRYEMGENLTEAARAMGLSRAKFDRLIFYARRHGEWPEGLSRKEGERPWRRSKRSAP